MRQGREERKKELMRKLDQVVEELLEREAGQEGPSLGEIEEEVLVLREKVERGYYYCPACEAGIFPPG